MTSTFLITGPDAVPLTFVLGFRIREGFTHDPGRPAVYYLTAKVRDETEGIDVDVTLASDSHDHGGLRAWLAEVSHDPDGPFLTLPAPGQGATFLDPALAALTDPTR